MAEDSFCIRSVFPSSGLMFFSERMRGVNVSEPAFKSEANCVISRCVKLPEICALPWRGDSRVGELMTVPLSSTAMRQPFPLEHSSRRRCLRFFLC